MVADGNASEYAYSWYLNEVPLVDPVYLNNNAIFLNFTKPGHEIVRVVVSDMKGGIASRTQIISVGDNSLSNNSLVSGNVVSKQNPVQGARVVLSKAPIIEHNVSLAGDIFSSFFPNGVNQPLKFLIDGKVAPELHFHRGEIHRLNFDASTKPASMSFMEGRENSPPQISINMLSDGQMDFEKEVVIFGIPPSHILMVPHFQTTEPNTQAPT